MRSLSSVLLVAASLVLAACSGPEPTTDAQPRDAATDAHTLADSGDAATDARALDDAWSSSDVGVDAPIVDAATPIDVGTDAGTLGSAGCGRAAMASVARIAIRVGTMDRSYVLSIPAGYDAAHAYPLVFAWHGRSATTASGNGFAFRGGMGAPNGTTGGVELAAGNAAIFVYPDGRPVTGPTGIGFDDREIDGPDYQLFDAILEAVTSNLCVDEAHVFSYGHSNGAYMSQTFACRRPGVLLGIAPVAGGPPWMSATCPAGPSPGVWLQHSRDDGTVSFATGMAARNYWHTRLSCDDTSSPAGGTCIAYDGCTRPFHWCIRETGGHGWPGAATGAAIWSFFTSL